MDMKIAHDIQEKQRTKDIEIDETITFEEMFLSDAVLNGLHACGYIQPSPIQLKAIPLGRCGLDLIVQAKSGTGKTCVFSVVALEMISVKAKTTQVLVIAPTREIAVQIGQVINSIGSAIPELKAYTFIGGINLMEDKAKLSCCHIAVGTPGRLNQLVSLGHLNLTNVRLLVLDEADQLLTGQFKSSILELVKTSPFNKQILALSATYPKEVTEFLDQYMRSSSHVRLGKESPALIGVKQFARLLPDHPQSHTRHKLKFRELLTILSSISFNQCLVFSNSQLRAESICNQLKSSGWPAAFLTGGQMQTERLQSYFALCSYKCRILVSTDLSARGLDSEHVNLIINLDIPMDQATYLHRIGRAGRFGSIGVAISLACEGMEWEAMRAVVNMANVTVSLLPEKFDTDMIQNKCETLETVEQLDEEKYSQFLERANKRKSKLNSHVSGPSVDGLSGKCKKILKEKENKTDKRLKKDKGGVSKPICKEVEEEEKTDLCNKTIKMAMHDYTKEAQSIPFSHDELVDKIAEDLENVLQFDVPHLRANSLLKEYPNTSVFTTLESYINNREREANAEGSIKNMKVKGNDFNSLKSLQNALDDVQLRDISMKDARNNFTPKTYNGTCSMEEKKLQNGHSDSNVNERNFENSDLERKLDSVNINENISINTSPVENVINSISEEGGNIHCTDITGETKRIEDSIVGMDEIKLGTENKKKSQSVQQKIYCKNTGYGAWETVDASKETKTKKGHLQLSCSSDNEFLANEYNFNTNHYLIDNSGTDEDMYTGNGFSNYMPDEQSANILHPYSYNVQNNYSQYCASSHMYVRSAQKFASMMEYARSLGKMSAWIAQDNNRKLLREMPRTKCNKTKIKTSDSSK